jgi:hypothetical protein
MSQHRQHYQRVIFTKPPYWTPLRVLFALTYVLSFAVLWWVL